MTETRRFLAPLPSLGLVAASSTLQAGKLNRYNALEGDLTASLPELGDLAFGSNLAVQKYDDSAHTVTIAVTGGSGDLIGNQLTSITLSRPLELVELMVINDTWEIVGHYLPAPAGTLVTTEGIAVLKGKTISGADNTFSNVPVTALGTGRVTGANASGPASRVLWTGTASQYASIPSKDPNTVYVVTES